jgi:hypothetical protein
MLLYGINTLRGKRFRIPTPKGVYAVAIAIRRAGISGFRVALDELSLSSLPEGRRRPLCPTDTLRNLTPVVRYPGFFSSADPRREHVACFSGLFACETLTIYQVAPFTLR